MKNRVVPRSEASTTPFLNTPAVETWDTWFRWRADGQLRDLTIDDTWERTASALAAALTRPAAYKHRLLDAFAAWQLLPDERVIATAGTTAPQWNADNLAAVLNAASFVRAPGLRHASFDYAHFEEVAALAMHALDDAAMLVAGHTLGAMPQTRVGLIGLSDALALLGLDYDSHEARTHAANVVQALVRGCLAGSIALARDRGERFRCGKKWEELAHRRGYPSALIAGAQRHGLRQREFTAITSQPRLAAFANGVADALDPLPGVLCTQADSYAIAVSQRQRGVIDAAVVPGVRACVSAQLRLRAAVQPWIDEPIDYPLNLDRPPSAAEIGSWNALARELGLGPLSWRFLSRSAHGDAARSELCDAGIG
jgi:ribonucleoside-diphosphate reductase alpha chain